MAYGLHADLPDGTATPGYEEWNQLLGSIRAVAFAPAPLGGSSTEPHPGAAYQRVPHAVAWQVPATEQTGGVFKARVYLTCEDAAVTITPKIRNITDGSDAVTGSACSGTAADYSGTNQNQLLTFTPTVGKIYELWAVKSATTKDCYCHGWIQRTNS